MCTAVIWGEKNRYFGRNLDHWTVYDEQVIITPRNYELVYRNGKRERSHLCMIGMGTVIDGYPLYYEATNEYGVSVAGLNFVGNAAYDVFHKGVFISGYGGSTAKSFATHPAWHVAARESHEDIAQFELIPYILGRCRTLEEARELLLSVNLSREQFAPELPLPELHWMIADRSGCITLEIMRDGMHIHENRIGVLTNNPPFDFHVCNLNTYLNVTRRAPTDRFGASDPLCVFSHGMGAIGLPGDSSSTSRFIRAAFVRANCNSFDGDRESLVRWSRHAYEYGGVSENMLAVEQFFHILSSVEQIDGCVQVGDLFERTQYSSCCDILTGKYYFRTYFDSRIFSVAMFESDVEGRELVCRRVSDMKH